MKLYVARTSPYARKIQVLIHEKDAAGLVQVLPVDPWTDPAALHAAVPAGKVPALVTGDGWSLGESWAIADYLDAVLPGRRLLPAEGAGRWRGLRLSALAQGMTDAAFAAVIEGRRPEGERSPGWVARQMAAITRSLPALEAAVPDLRADGFGLGGLSVAVALDYLDFRHAGLDWRGDCPALAVWFAQNIGRSSLCATDPR
ncbi:glutathione S-transferase N-terminal domain-containing protein [Niveispirillum fermenti]|uniref:glutathione S-transferase N-terminal domain-containing protein n=1 Tax=Niveispirillum fermenti TaxID=1233113 RepID=UPI003A849B54